MKYIFVAVILFGITGCYNSILKIRLINNTKNIIQVLDKSHHYININPSKLMPYTLFLFHISEESHYFIIKNKGIVKKYIFDFNALYTDKIHKLNRKYNFPPVIIEIGKNVDVVFPENIRITLPEVKKNKCYDIRRDKLLQKVE